MKKLRINDSTKKVLVHYVLPLVVMLGTFLFLISPLVKSLIEDVAKTKADLVSVQRDLSNTQSNLALAQAQVLRLQMDLTNVPAEKVTAVLEAVNNYTRSADLLARTKDISTGSRSSGGKFFEIRLGTNAYRFQEDGNFCLYAARPDGSLDWKGVWCTDAVFRH